MIPLYYDIKNERWYQSEYKHPMRWGSNNKKIPYLGSISTAMLPFYVSNHGEKISPLVGVLVGDSYIKKSFLGKSQMLIRLQQELEKNGSLCFVFTPLSISGTNPYGFYYLNKRKKWIRLKMPLPDIVYNRASYRRIEKTKKYKKCLTLLEKNNIPYFNPSFFSKSSIYELIQKHPKLSKHLPATTMYSKSSFQEMLHKYNSLYIKADSGSKGKGIYKVSVEGDQYIVKDMFKEWTFRSYTEMQSFVQSRIKNEKYIVQETIDSTTFESKRYDLRVLAHDSEKGFVISGIGVRRSIKQDVTTHVPNGGEIIPFSKVKHQIDSTKVKRLIVELGNYLNKEYSGKIGEFSVDLGKSKDGRYYIYEVNSKPMIFDEPYIEQKRMKNLAKLLLFKAKKAKEY